MKLLTPPQHVLGVAALAAFAGLASCAADDPATGDQHPPRASQPARAVLTERPTASSFVAASGAAPAIAVDRFRVGSTAEDRPIYVYRVSKGEGDPDAKPGLLIVAGIDARHTAGPVIARELVGSLEREADLEHATVYVIPRVNRDAQDRDTLGLQAPGGTLTPEDADRDGRTDEDGPQDLNGDGHVTMMRVADPPAKYGLSLTHMVDPDHPRLMRRADASKGEVATHAMLVESSDQDGDGRFAEDGLGGVDLNQNFPYRWPEFGNSIGAYPLSEAESKALATWLLERPNIVAAIVYGPHDTIVNVPEAGRFDQTGRVPLGIERGDKPLMDRLSEMYKEATGLTKADKVSWEGSFPGWAYAHLGLVTIATNPWQLPEPPKEEGNAEEQATDDAARQEEPSDEPPFVMIGDYKLVLTQEAIQAAMMEAQSMSPQEQQQRMAAFEALPEATRQRIMTIAQGAPDPMAAEQEAQRPQRPARPARRGGGNSSEDAKWLAYADRVGSGYVDWQPFDHPQLGEIEIGGFVPGFRLNPPEEDTASIIEAQAKFIMDLLSMMPRIVIEEPVVEQAGEGVYRVSITVRNDGEMPTRSAMSVKARRLTPHVIALQLPQDRVLTGSVIERANSIEPGGTVRVEWLVLGEAGETVSAQLRTEEFGTTDIAIELSDAQAGGN